MKITFLISDLSLQRGGERVTAVIANALTKKEQVHIISLYQINEKYFYDFDRSIQITVVNPYQANRNKVFQKLNELFALSNYIYKADVDFMIGVGTYCSVLMGMFSWLNRNIKYLAWEHSSYMAPTKKWRLIRQLFYKGIDAIVCLNSTDQANYSQKFNQVYVIQNPLSFSTTEKASLKNKQVLSIGALEEEKGFDLLIEAFHQFKGDEEWKLLIIGEGSKKEELKRLIEHYKLQNRVTILPYTNDICHVYLEAGLFVLPSRREGFGMVLLEAMECGLPCIAFDCPTGPAHLIKNEINGLLVPAQNIIKLSESIERVAQNNELAKKFVAQSHLTLASYQQDLVLSLWYGLFKRQSA